MINLPDVTVIIADTKNYPQAIYAIKKTQEQINPAEFVWITDRLDLHVDGVRMMYIKPFTGKADYSHFLIKNLANCFSTSHCLVIQHDGYVLSGDAWDESWLYYDYIGAPWLYPDPERNVGNGGFSLRSKSLCTALELDPCIEIAEPEDEVIGRLYRRYLELHYDLKFASEEVAHKFSYELHEPYGKTFGFHGYFHPPFREVVVLNRTGAMGDVIQIEPLMHYFWQKGCRVVLKTLPQFYSLFASHYFPVESYDTFNKAVPHRIIDLDMAYEVKPKQLHIKSYFEMAGVADGVIRNARLNYFADENLKIFKQKYAVIHIDRREQEHRNAYTAWWRITDYLKSKGYLIVQIGKNDAIELDAIQLRTIAEPMMAYVISGCDLFIGVDSGPSHIAVATQRKCVLFFGSVNPEYIHADFSNIRIVTNHNDPCISEAWSVECEDEKPVVWKGVCDTPYCWHNSVTTTGQECMVNKAEPPCSKFKSENVIDAINDLI